MSPGRTVGIKHDQRRDTDHVSCTHKRRLLNYFSSVTLLLTYSHTAVKTSPPSAYACVILQKTTTRVWYCTKPCAYWQLAGIDTGLYRPGLHMGKLTKRCMQVHGHANDTERYRTLSATSDFHAMPVSFIPWPDVTLKISLKSVLAMRPQGCNTSDPL